MSSGWLKHINPTQILSITCAYETGLGRALQGREGRLSNPYEEDSPEYLAYQYGVKEGETKRWKHANRRRPK